MFRLSTAQKSFTIGGVRLGGRPGERPTVLIGSLFYRGQRLVSDEKVGRFDRERARRLLEEQDQLSGRTGNPCMVDLVASTSKAMQRYIDFASEVTEAPLLIDSTSSAARVEGVRHAVEVGLADRIVYNSILPSSTPQELEAIHQLRLEQAVLLAFPSNLSSTKDRVQAVVGGKDGKGLLELAEKYGIIKPLVDTCVLDIPSLGMACQAIAQLKDQHGLVCGCGSHNAIDTWRGLKLKFRDGLRETGVASSAVLATMAGADFILYGPMEHASAVFPMVAMADAALGQLIFEETGNVNPKHPLFKIA